MDKEYENHEIEKRERLVQTYLLISGFLLAYNTKQDFQEDLIAIFSAYLIITIIYYVYVSRTKMYIAIDLFGILSSIFLSALISFFLHIESSGIIRGKILLFYIGFLAIIFSYSLLSVETSSMLDNKVKKLALNIASKLKNEEWFNKYILDKMKKDDEYEIY